MTVLFFLSVIAQGAHVMCLFTLCCWVVFFKCICVHIILTLTPFLIEVTRHMLTTLSPLCSEVLLVVYMQKLHLKVRFSLCASSENTSRAYIMLCDGFSVKLSQFFLNMLLSFNGFIVL